MKPLIKGHYALLKDTIHIRKDKFSNPQNYFQCVLSLPEEETQILLVPRHNELADAKSLSSSPYRRGVVHKVMCLTHV